MCTGTWMLLAAPLMSTAYGLLASSTSMAGMSGHVSNQMELPLMQTYACVGSLCNAMIVPRSRGLLSHVSGCKAEVLCSHEQVASRQVKLRSQNPAHGPVQVGLVQLFFKYRPWVAIDDDYELNAADVRWMKPYSCTTELHGASVVSKSIMLHCVQGDLARADGIIPTYLCLVPNLDSRHADRWQVLHIDCSFLTKYY